MHKKQIRQLISKKSRGQGMVEFAIALPVVLLIVFGIIEVGFLLFSYSSVNSAAREAARYGIAIGDVGAAQRYYDCDGIVDAGLTIGRFAGMTASDISIGYDNGPETTVFATCAGLTSDQITDISFGDRIVVTVNHQYQPLIAYMGLNIAPFTMTSTSARTIFKDAEIIPGGGGDEGGGGGGGGGEDTCYSLTFSVIGGTGGEPSRSPAWDCPDGSNSYAAGTEVTLTGNPDTDAGYYTFSWLGVSSIDADDNNIAYITMNADANVTINYTMELVTCYSLGEPYVVSGDGAAPSVTNVSDSCGDGKFKDGETVNFLAYPNVGSMTTDWTGATSTGTDTASMTMPASDGTQVGVTYTAMDCYGLSLGVGGDGTGGSSPVALTESAVCGANMFMPGEVVTLQAYPAEGYDVDYWDGAVQKPLDANQATFTMPEGIQAVTVTYIPEPVLDPPLNPNVSAWKWDNGQGGRCTITEFEFFPNLAPGGNWPRTPDYYNVNINIDTASGLVSSVYQVNGDTATPTWSGSAIVELGKRISLGVEGVFLSDPADTSIFAEVTYVCYTNDLNLAGYQEK